LDFKTPQGLKPQFLCISGGTAEAVPFPNGSMGSIDELTFRAMDGRSAVFQARPNAVSLLIN